VHQCELALFLKPQSPAERMAAQNREKLQRERPASEHCAASASASATASASSTNSSSSAQAALTGGLSNFIKN